MIIAISSQGPTLESPLDPRFGRAAYFIVYDTEAKTFTALDNAANVNASQGAGIQAAQTVADTGATLLVTGQVGPKAQMALDQAGITVQMVQAQTVQQALDMANQNGASQGTAQPQNVSQGAPAPGARTGRGMGPCGGGMGPGGRGAGAGMGPGGGMGRGRGGRGMGGRGMGMGGGMGTGRGQGQ